QAFSGEYIVKFKSENDMRYSLYQAKSTNSTAVVDAHRKGLLAKWLIKSKSERDEAKQLARLMARPDVEYVVENFKFQTLLSDDNPVGDNPDEDVSDDNPVGDNPDEDVSGEDPNGDEPNGDEPEQEEPTEDEPAEVERPAPQKQWAMDKIHAPDAWATVRGKNSVLVAVIDTGVDASHEDLADRIYVNKKEIPDNNIDDDGNGYIDDVSGWDFFENDNDPNDVTSARNKGHGTHCAGIIGAIDENKTGISGIAQNVQIMPLRFLGPNGSGDLLNAVKAIDYAIASGVQVISASWGARVSNARAKPVLEAVERAEKAGILFVAAAANNGKSNDKETMYPANAPYLNVISVAASGEKDTRPRWSNYGEGRVHLAAPGEGIVSTLPGNKYAKLSGTSMATPLVAGMAALMLSEMYDDEQLTPLQVRSIMQATGEKVKIETACNCRIDAAKALDRLQTHEMTVVPLTSTIGIKRQQKFDVWGAAKGDLTYKVTDDTVAQIDADGLLTGLRKGRTQVVITDASGQSAQSMDVRVGLSGAPSLCPFSKIKCFFVCIVSWKKPWCYWNRNKLKSSMDEFGTLDLSALEIR
ncbi:S8 family serine peptidase, partial [Oligoflexaceae bacterium]|nr:S8 family serine peptidase [Oligoflexaceae bacterium]